MGWLWSVRKGKKLEMKLWLQPEQTERELPLTDTHTHSCRSDFKEEDQDISSGQIKFEMPIRH